MRNLSKIIFMGLFFANSFIINAQEQNVEYSTYAEVQGGLPYIFRINPTWETQTSEKIYETPYLFNDFKRDTFKTSTGEYLLASMRYNIFDDRIEVNKSDTIYTLFPPEEMYEIKLNNDILVYSKYLVESNLQEGYFVLKSKGKYNILVKKKKKVLKNREYENLEEQKNPRYVSKRDKVYLKIDNQPAVHFKNIRKFSKENPEFKSLINRYMSYYRVKSKDAESLKNLFDYLNNHLNEN